MNLEQFYSRHDRVALMFSGGKDSIACLRLVEQYLDRTLVVWVSTGADFPEITELMSEVRQLVPYFLEIQTDQPSSIRRNGYPSDVVPIKHTPLGQMFMGAQKIKIRSAFECCSENKWLPTSNKLKELGVTGVIRGQRSDDTARAPLASGDWVDGVEYLLPIADWSKEQVLDYLAKNNVPITDRLLMEHSSLDCWNCTAYLEHSADRMRYVKKNYPDKYQEVTDIIKRIGSVVALEASNINKILEI